MWYFGLFCHAKETSLGAISAIQDYYQKKQSDRSFILVKTWSKWLYFSVLHVASLRKSYNTKIKKK